MVLLLAAVLAIAAAMIVLYPLLGLSRDAEGRIASGGGELAERERAAKGALREVEFDYRLGNLESADYEELRERYEARALSALQTRYTRERTLDALIDRQLATLRTHGAHGERKLDQDTTGAPERRQATGATPKRTANRRRRGGGGGSRG